MKILTLILSFIIFSQSLSVCGPSISHPQTPLVLKECKIDISGLINENDHSCCIKKDQSCQEDENKDCCGDDCKCFCCIKVCLNNFYYYKTAASDLSVFTEKNNTFIGVHSFDFHPSISYPPQV